MHVANTVAHGIHGRRRAGTGETFWQFRQFQASDPATVIDWRRSASSDHLYVREREWEAAHTFWLWPDISPSMLFRSHLSPISKRDRALVLTLAIAELLVRAGERIALIGLTPPMASRKATSRIAETLAVHEGDAAMQKSLPPPARLSRFSSALLFGDFLDPPQTIAARLNEMAESGVTGHLVQVLDPTTIRWIAHVTGIEVSVEPLTEMREVDLQWYVGLDAEATRIGDALWTGEQLDKATPSQIVGLFRLNFRDPHIVLEQVGTEPVYLILAMSRDKIVRMKPQNLIAGLPVRQTDAVS